MQEERSRRPTTGIGGGGVVVGARGGNVPAKVEAPANSANMATMASITPTAREATRGSVVASRQLKTQKSSSINKDDPSASRDDLESSRIFESIKPSHPSTRSTTSGGTDTITDKFKGTVDSLLKASEVTQGRLSEKSMLKIEKSKIPIDLGKSKIPIDLGKPKVPLDPGKSAEKMKSGQDSGFKHEASKSKISHEPLAYSGYKVENIKYYGELKGYDFKSYGNIDRPPGTAHEKSHQHSSSEKGYQVNHDKCQANKSLQGYAKGGQSEKSVYSDKYSDNYYMRGSHVKPQNPYQVYQETKYSYNVSGTPGTPAQASAAAAFFAR